MENSVKIRTTLATMLAISFFLSSTPAIASPQDKQSFEDLLHEVSSQPEAAVSSIEDIGRVGRDLIAESDIGVATIPSLATSSEGIKLTTELGTVELPLPAEAAGQASVVSGNSVLYADGEAPTIVQLIDGDSVRIQTITADINSPHSFEYSFPSEWSVGVLSDGSAWAASDEDSESAPVVSLAQPWAFDSNGNPIATHYAIEGTSIIQVIEPGESAVYPIISDPKYSLGKGIYIHFNRAETKTIASGGWAATGLAAVCAAAGLATGSPWGPTVLGGLCLAASGTIVYQAGVAENSNPKKCLFINLRPGVRVGGYKDSRCK